MCAFEVKYCGGRRDLPKKDISWERLFERVERVHSFKDPLLPVLPLFSYCCTQQQKENCQFYATNNNNSLTWLIHFGLLGRKKKFERKEGLKCFLSKKEPEGSQPALWPYPVHFLAFFHLLSPSTYKLSKKIVFKPSKQLLLPPKRRFICVSIGRIKKLAKFPVVLLMAKE